MRSSVKFFTSVACLLLSPSILRADPLPEQMTFTPWAEGVWKSEWQGVPKRTYFHQWSTDLVNWSYSPFMKFGIGPHECFPASSTGKFFLRLFTVDEVGVSTLQQARDADFDNDRIPNYYEVETVFTDPMDRSSAGGDSDMDGLPDGWEMFQFETLSHDGSQDFDEDLISNFDEYAIGSNPLLQPDPTLNQTGSPSAGEVLQLIDTLEVESQFVIFTKI